MEGLRYLVRLFEFDSSRDVFLATVRSLARSAGADARNPKWTSYGALELDLFCNARGDFDLFLSVVHPLARLEFSRDLNVAQPHRSEEELFSEARDYFNSERFWECHEVLEGIWRLKQGEEKRVLQGLILVCAAFVHHQKGEEDVALGVLGRAHTSLENTTADYGGFKIQSLKAKAEEMLRSKHLSVFRI